MNKSYRSNCQEWSQSIDWDLKLEWDREWSYMIEWDQGNEMRRLVGADFSSIISSKKLTKFLKLTLKGWHSDYYRT